ncbi:unnamed protein product [Schistocephalus solidus]|uniref:ABC transporter domain-containing protein n=1 Tax=Schistocephalus solidus TaxID=70667 RepID=A0A183SDA1_SCHSO|nr:unnamed protein product [Schistocephalus solidus]
MARDEELGLKVVAAGCSEVPEKKTYVRQHYLDENLNNIWSRLTSDKICGAGQFANNIEFHELVYAVFQGRGMQPKFLLKSISGKFSSGQLIAIMGPSGAGKSTLMNVLAGFKTRNVSGQILINSKPGDLKTFRRSSCFILQDAPLLSQLTVAEAMFCSSQLNLPRHLSSEQRTIDEILQVLGLTEAKRTRTHALSGGQRKRLSIAQEMVNNPPIMFFDEPTSGLDSAASLQCIAALQTIARQGRTVICTIHQPSAKVFDMFDQVRLQPVLHSFHLPSHVSNMYFLVSVHCLRDFCYTFPNEWIGTRFIWIFLKKFRPHKITI